MLVIMAGSGICAIYSDYQPGPRPSAMGGAGVAVADDVDAVYWNPAGLGLIQNNEIGFQHSNVFNVGIYQEYLSLVHPLGKGVGIGFAWIHHDANLEEGFLTTSRTNKWDDDVYILGFGTKLRENAALGLNIKRYMINTKITSGGTAAGAGIGFDVSLLIKSKKQFSELNIKDIKYGIMLRNVATDFNSEKPNIEYKIGISAKIMDEILGAFDLVSTDDDKGDRDYLVYVGAEYNVNKNFILRMGLNDGSFTAGLGIKYLEKVKINYSFQSKLSDVGEDNHKFSLSYLF